MREHLSADEIEAMQRLTIMLGNYKRFFFAVGFVVGIITGMIVTLIVT
jgi:hypothetical protein